MAIIHYKFLYYTTSILSKSFNSPAYLSDPILELAEHCYALEKKPVIDFLIADSFSDNFTKSTFPYFLDSGILGVISSYFDNKFLNQFTSVNIERKIYTLKKGFSAMPATKMKVILEGFNYTFDKEQILSIFASYGLTRSLKYLSEKFNFIDINRRIEKLDQLIKKSKKENEVTKLNRRYSAIRNYLLADKKDRVTIIKNSGMSHSLFFYYWKSFKKYGFLGLVDKGKESFRESKIKLENEAKIIIDKIQHPDRKDIYYLKQLQYKGINIYRSAIANIFKRWNVLEYQSRFISNLDRLEKSPFNDQIEVKKIEQDLTDKKPTKHVDSNFILFLKSLKENELHIDAPGLFVLWVYLEQLGILSKLEKMDLTYVEKGYSWFDYFLLNIARIFYGIPSYSRTSIHEEPSLAFFTHLLRLPCNDSFINGLAIISEEQAFNLQKWIINRLKYLNIIKGKRLAFDFHHIDLDVELSILRKFGKGPSPKKKICYNGFRPHIAWDLDTGTIIVTEYRKASSRGTSTFKRFIKDFLKPIFDNIFEQVYIDSEYTSRHVWDFILEKDKGMGAHLVACLKQNNFVKKYRDKFLFENQNKKDFWTYYDDDHIYSSQTFELKWDYIDPETKNKKEFILYCLVKKNIKNGTLRCFATSKNNQSSKLILEDYSSRWIIENGIKDLINSYYLDKVPGTYPHIVNIHFMTVTFCKQLFRLIQDDLGDLGKNADGSIKSLLTMRDLLFRQGSAKITLKNNILEVNFLNNYSPKLTTQLNNFYQIINKKGSKELDILGGLKIKYNLKPPHGEEYKNSFKKIALNESLKILKGANK